MHTTRILLLCGLLTCASVQAGTYEWTSGWGMGVSEHLVDDGNGNGNGNELNISCPEYEEDGYVRAYASIGGRQYSSEEGSGFDVIVDGEIYNNPFFTDCRVCGAHFPGFWEALRQANHLKLMADGKTINLPTPKNLQRTPAAGQPGKQLPIGLVRQPERRNLSHQAVTLYRCIYINAPKTCSRT